MILEKLDGSLPFGTVKKGVGDPEDRYLEIINNEAKIGRNMNKRLRCWTLDMKKLNIHVAGVLERENE